MKGTTRPTRARWTDMTVSELLDVAPGAWMDTAVPGWRQSMYGTYLQSTPAEVVAAMYPSLGTVTPGTWPRQRPRHQRHGRDWRYSEHEHRHHEHRHRWHEHDCECHEHGRRCRCEDCAEEPCECICCLGDVDMVVYTRVGERRVVPIEIENERRREATVKVELSEWTTRAGNPAPVHATLAAPLEFTLEPCGSHKLTLTLEVSAPESGQGKPAAREGREPLRDVESCLVATADLRLVGCDHRPLRIATAILPRYCDPFHIDCGCGCC